MISQDDRFVYPYYRGNGVMRPLVPEFVPSHLLQDYNEGKVVWMGWRKRWGSRNHPSGWYERNTLVKVSKPYALWSEYVLQPLQELWWRNPIRWEDPDGCQNRYLFGLIKGRVKYGASS